MLTAIVLLMLVCRSMFDAFDMNAAADGLFHPASTISAFIEHDAKYNSAARSGRADAKDSQKSGKSSRKATPKGDGIEESAATSDELLAGSASRLKELPVLSGRGSAASLRLLHTRGSSRSSSASSFASSSSSSRESTATRSDSDLLLLAPRRLGAIPSSADRSALDFYEHDEDDSEGDYNGDNGNDMDGRRQVPESDGAEEGGGAFDLATKFAALKEMFHQNQGSRSGRANAGQKPTETEEDRKAAGEPKLATPPASSTVKDHGVSSGPTVRLGANKHGYTSRVSAAKASTAASTNATASVSSLVVGHSRLTKPAVPTRREAKATAAGAASENTEAGHDGSAGDKKPKKKEGKTPSGMSLTDLKEEHRAALELLKELGGPSDTEFRDEDMDRSIRLLAARSGKTTSVGGATSGRLVGGRIASTHAVVSKAPANSYGVSKTAVETSLQHTAGPRHHSGQQQECEPEDADESEGEAPLRPLSSSSSASLVSRLRSSVALGRVSSHEDAADDANDDIEREGVDAVPSLRVVDDADSSPHVSDIIRHSFEQQAQSTDETRGVGGVLEIEEGTSCNAEPESAGELQWKQYCVNFDDTDVGGDDEEEDEEESPSERKKDLDGENDDSSAMARGYTPMSSRSVDNCYSDEGFEADW
jgi:hypothetical protein